MTDFEEVDKETTATEPVVSIRENTDSLGILVGAYKEMDEPEALRLFTDGRQIGLKPADPDDLKAYSVTKQGGSYRVTFGWFEKENDLTPVPGRYPIEYDSDNEMWIVEIDVEEEKEWGFS